MGNGSLNPKQQRFVAEYLVDLNATQAAIRAGYSKRTAQRIGSENLSKPLVAAAVAAGQVERAERTEITQDYVLATITETIERCKQAEAVKGRDGKVIDGEFQFNPTAVLKGAELLGRHLAMFTDKTINKHQIEELTDDEIATRLAEYDNATTTPRTTH